MTKINKIKNPILFQGNINNNHYFEGWYYKQVSASTNKIISFIPGISLNPSDSHSFIQVIVSPPVKTYYFRYPIEQFNASDQPFEIKIGRSSFTEREAKINLVNENILIEGHLTYGNFSKINTSIISPNIMGCFAYIPKMECNHGVISMDHSVNGLLKYGNTHLEFLNDRGYIEKDWGTSFPEQYIWIQANNFEKQGDSFMCSIAKIPMLGVKFNGLIANLHYNGKEYRFATYNNSKISEISHNKDGVSLKLSKKDIKLFIHAIFDTKGSLKAPTKGTMSNTIKEGLGGKISLTLTQKGKTMAEITSPYAGIEIVGYGTEVTDRKLKI